jgi:DNA invertase Pin-like site-specific DNA recombinase
MGQVKLVAYYRVSTGRQGRSGLGLEAQVQTVRERLNGGNWSIVGSFTEIETGTAKRARPELARALALCRVMGARLIVANVSRLTRDPDFMGRLVAAGVEVEFCDLPRTDGPVGRFMLRQMLSVAELEAGMIAERTRKALAAAKSRGVKLGGDRGNLATDGAKGRAASLRVRTARAADRAADLAPIIAEIRSSGATTLAAVAAVLNAREVPTARGGRWKPVQVQRVEKRAI